ncbi:MAG: SPOR domain-containing protein [Gammaproteobacteria bacterium]
MASLSNKNNAMALQTRLRGLGYSTFVEEARTAQGVVFRVRVGPELERANAEKLRDRLEQQVQLKGLVTRYP